MQDLNNTNKMQDLITYLGKYNLHFFLQTINQTKLTKYLVDI